MITDLTWLSQEAQKIHDIFYGMFFSLATVMLLIGITIEYFKLPISGAANFSSLVGRTLVATILLVAYPEITEAIAEFGDGLATKIGGLNNLDSILEKTAGVLTERSWSWTDMGDTLVWVISYIVYALLYVTVFIFDAVIMYGWTVLYIFSPILILMYILPQTSGATSLLFKSHFELASYKVVWSTLGTLLWSTALSNLDTQLAGEPNFFVILSFMVLVAFSILLTPKIVSALTTTGMAGTAAGLGALGASALSAGTLSTAGLSKLAGKPATFAKHTGAKLAQAGINRSKVKLGLVKSEEPKNQRSNRIRRRLTAGSN